LLVCALLSLMGACHPVRKRTGAGGGGGRVTLAVLPAESDAFPKAARAITDSLSRADVSGIDSRQVSKVSLEVVQLSIECVEPTVSCYAAVGKSLSANRLLFAQIEPGGKKQLKVKVTLFDVDARNPHSAEKLFPNEKAASDGIGELVTEATR
jgi:hypothetical protein